MNWEIGILQGLQSIRNPLFTACMEAVSFMAESLFLVVIIATLYWCIDKKKTIRIGWYILVSGVTNGVIKNIVRAPRPFQRGVVSPIRVETATSYSFPSGHTQGATSFWFGAARLFPNRNVIIIGTIMVMLTALSRLYLGVHWPIDVIAGIIVGILSVFLADFLYDEKKGFTTWHVIGVSILAIVMIGMPVEGNLTSAVGALWGFVVSIYLEQTYIKFSVEGDWKLQFKKILLGFAVTAFLYVGFESIFGEAPLLQMIQHAIVLLWIGAGAPYVFKKLWPIRKG